MKKIMILFTVVAFVASGCAKRKDFKNENGQVSEDNRNIQAETDQAINDANNVVSNNATLNGKIGQYTLSEQAAAMTSGNVCGATVDTTLKTSGIVTLNFDGVTVCNNRKRAGSVKATIIDYATGKRWKDPGCVLQLDYTNYKVTRASDGENIKFNGTLRITNVTGGNLILLLLGWTPNETSLVHQVEGTGIQITFNEDKTATWNISRKYTYTKSMNGSTTVITCTGEGTGSNNGLSTLENWGTTRDGDDFTSQVTEPVVWNTTCGLSAPVTGKLVIAVTSKEFELTTYIGVDAGGTPTTPTVNFCPYGLKVEWKWKNKTGSKIYKYY
ncbi:MAG: hypothetical protein V2A54_03555 [Bacteroidota bacterium]